VEIIYHTNTKSKRGKKGNSYTIKLSVWWQKVYNTIRTNMGLGDLTPYQKLRSLNYTTPQEFCLFPTLILDRLVTLPDILDYPKSVQEHLDYDLSIVILVC
jgi:hypothetical protein